jgi:hypothetical protein
MRLPHWLVVTLLTVSVFAVLDAGAVWWVAWPTRTMNKFVVLLRAGDLDSANKMIIDSDTWQNVRLELSDRNGIRIRCVWGYETWEQHWLV